MTHWLYNGLADGSLVLPLLILCGAALGSLIDILGYRIARK